MTLLAFVRVNGPSMAPTLEDGDFVLVVGSRLAPRPRVGAVVVVAHRELGTIVKRVVGRSDDGRLRLAGDNAMSIATDRIGLVPADAVRGVAYLRVDARGRMRCMVTSNEPCETRHPP